MKTWCGNICREIQDVVLIRAQIYAMKKVLNSSVKSKQNMCVPRL